MHKYVVDAVVGCWPVYSRLISVRLGAAPFIITIIQVYAPASSHDDSEVDYRYFYQQLLETIDQTPKKDILVGLYKGTGMLKLGRMHQPLH